jgi:hypothetical protein
LPGHVHQFHEKPLHTVRSVPAHDVGRYLIADAVRQDARMVAAKSRSLPDSLPGVILSLAAVQEAQMLGPGNVNKDTQSLFVGQMKQPAGRRMVGPDSVDGGGFHLAEIFSDTVGRGKRLAVDIGGKRTISDTVEAKFLTLASEVFAVDFQPFFDRQGKSIPHGFVRCGELGVHERLPLLQGMAGTVQETLMRLKIEVDDLAVALIAQKAENILIDAVCQRTHGTIGQENVKLGGVR